MRRASSNSSGEEEVARWRVFGDCRHEQAGDVAALVPFRVFVLPKIFSAEEFEVLGAHQDSPPDSEEVVVKPEADRSQDVQAV